MIKRLIGMVFMFALITAFTSAEARYSSYGGGSRSFSSPRSYSRPSYSRPVTRSTTVVQNHYHSNYSGGGGGGSGMGGALLGGVIGYELGKSSTPNQTVVTGSNPVYQQQPAPVQQQQAPVLDQVTQAQAQPVAVEADHTIVYVIAFLLFCMMVGTMIILL